MSDLTDMIKRHEGTGPIKDGRFLPYQDSVGKSTVGWGRNLDDRGISEAEADFFLSNDVRDNISDPNKEYPWLNFSDRIKGDRFTPYKNEFEKKLTIGWDRDINGRGISKEEATQLLENDIEDIMVDLERNHPWFINLDPVRKDAVTDMAFNLGISRFNGFRKFHSAMAAQNWPLAAAEMLDSKWADQVGRRAIELSAMMLTGQYRRK